ncbi:amino acid ABC transporter membrane protein 2 (PAAT family) [Mobilisporobacter senegalensis]|uniref:Amino acid ABC transporter membrane protein 2 (PAAT family) n=1 Tax=Mobilisporobacter senegalensis TaxID=1329262 RepID=A0A3N1X6G2_9FIRM|nr:amino acid ABC transporter permease [Mobilisporobacter senegalensis]ROR22384.1 amino acid ABC transporter membrane protein 2 (PAAT family) [Mobilisporobacter senegalensis]
MQSLGPKVIIDNLPLLLDGLGNTLLIAFISMIISIATGFLFGILRTSKNKLLKLITDIYLEAFRIVPIMVWLFIMYFFVPRALGISVSGEFAAITIFVMWGTAEMGDIVRGALESLPKSQLEAGLSVGLSRSQLFIYIQLPQAIKRIVPGAISLSTRMIKTTSLVVLIGVIDIIKRGQQVIERTKEAFWIYGFLFVVFFIICYPLSISSKKLEEKWAN